MKSEIKVNIYDLSQGWAKNMSPIVLGKKIDGIWHTGILAFGKEYFYGGGIQYDYTENVQDLVGKPVETQTIGHTELTKELFHDYLDGLRPKYNDINYNLFTQNCNHFSNEVAEFLTGKGIPEHIVNLPDVCQNTLVGSMIKSFMEKMNLIGTRIDNLD